MYIISIVPIFLICLLATYLGIKIVRPPRLKAKRSFALEITKGRNLKLRPNEHIELDAWLVENDNTDTIVVVTHELGACKETKFRLARILSNLDVSALFFDLRNHGQSSIDKNLLNQGERYTDDIECALHKANELGYKKIILYATSFSTFPALYVLKRANPGIKVSALIMDSGPVYDLHNIIKTYMEAHSKRLLPWFVREGIPQWLIYKIQTFVLMALFNVKWPIQDIRTIPKLFILGKNDIVANIDNVKQLQTHYQNSSLWLVPEAGHLRTIAVNPENYQNQLKEFMETI